MSVTDYPPSADASRRSPQRSNVYFHVHTDYFFIYDANGNVINLIDEETKEVVAHYEYDPFGRTILKIGSSADENEYRFSTKRFDSHFGLYYYGYRHYLPNLGRWLTRDPIGEKGGLNLYGFVGNDGVSGVDFWGLKNFRNCLVAVISGHYDWVGNLINSANIPSYTRLGPLSCFNKEINDKIPKKNRISNFPTTEDTIGKSKLTNNAGCGKGKKGYKKLFRKAVNAAKKEAKELAKDCKCQCKEILVVVKCQKPKQGGAKTLFKYKQQILKNKCNKILRRYKCQKNPRK